MSTAGSLKPRRIAATIVAAVLIGAGLAFGPDLVDRAINRGGMGCDPGTVQVVEDSVVLLPPPRIDGDWIVWADATSLSLGSKKGEQDILAYNITTGRTVSVASTDSDETTPLISGDTIVWTARPPDKSASTIRAMDMGSGRQRTLDLPFVRHGPPLELSGATLFMEGRVGETDGVFSYDMNNGTVRRVTGQPSPWIDFDAHAAAWVWQAAQNPARRDQIMLSDLQTSETTLAVDNPENRSYTDLGLDGGTIVFEAGPSEQETESGALASQVYAYMIAAGTLYPVARSSGDGLNQQDVRIGGDWVAYVEFGAAGGSRLKAYNLMTQRTLTVAERVDAGIDLRDGRVAFVQIDANNEERNAAYSCLPSG